MNQSKKNTVGLILIAAFAIVSYIGFMENLSSDKGASHLVASGVAFLIFVSLFAVGFKLFKQR